MASPLICPQCGSYSVSWMQEFEEFQCQHCDAYFNNEEHIEKYFYTIDLVDYQLDTLPGWVCGRWYLKKIDLSAEPDDWFHAPFVNRIKTIPPEVKFLEYIEELNLTHNMIRVVPPEIGCCTNLIKLKLACNCISYLPPSIGNLKKLEELYLRDNNLDELPPQIGELKNLQWLTVNDNKLRFLPQEIGNLKSLEVLHLENNQLDSLPEEIGLLTNLEVLNIEHNRLKTLPRSIGNMTKLKEFSITGNSDLVSPPYEVALQGITAIKDWFNLLPAGRDLQSRPQ